MLNMKHQFRGMTLIELMVTLTIAAVLMAVGAPAFSTWLQNTRIRTTAESIVSGLQYAKSEATTRNTTVRFQLTSSVDATCVLSLNGTSWVVDLADAGAANDSVEGSCNSAPSDTVQPAILQTRAGRDGSGNTTVTASASNVIFNGLGRLAPAPAAAITINVNNTNSDDDCAAGGGNLTCLRVLISPAGQVRMCNPRYPVGDPQAC
ncbi:GspH/FimT family pseudopilin [Roseateles albus]|uniref:Type II secretion system protein H n=1 Tax=Roseateles albus TaxID=2987525 RepID=A0ABT5KF19_9BURK|nr:GspH/FimT family pseudopilin [Roseateles albus]MDC8771585.1 GspH/FimT family pseudopilin [Roseateles albus]